jgi:hypothetical protein
MPVAGDSLVRTLQIIGAALGIPAAAAGSFAAYQSYFSAEVTCQKLRNDLVSIMERKLSPDAKRSLLKRGVAEFDKLCGEDDPDARAIFQAAIGGGEPAMADGTAHAPALPARARPAPEGAHPGPVAIFGAAGAREQSGWVALSRWRSGAWIPHFTGYDVSESSLPPPGTVLTARIMLPVWSEPQAGKNDPGKLQSRLPQGACVRVLAARGGTGRLWAEVAPAACS